jgi:RND family efflux transporter MFP subunit
MRLASWVGCGLVVFCLVVRDGSAPATIPASASPTAPAAASARVESPALKPAPSTSAGTFLEVVGHTQCAPGRRASIAPVPLHPVIEVKVAAGDRVTKGQLLVKMDDDEARADVRLKQALLESAQHSSNEARRFLAKALANRQVLPEQKLYEAELAARKSAADERAARAALDSAEAELEHFSVGAVIDGIVSRLDVYPGLVSRPGTAVWGEIVDLRELDVRCELTPEQADELEPAQDSAQHATVRLGATSVEVRARGERLLPGARLVFVGPVADPKTGLVPVLVRVPNPDQRLRCGVPVSVRFTNAPAVCTK